MGGGAHDLVVEQASQPPHALGEEGGELASTRSACLRPHLTQLGGFRIESKIRREEEVPTSISEAQAIEMLSGHPNSDMFVEEYGRRCTTGGIVEACDLHRRVFLLGGPEGAIPRIVGG